MTCGIYVMWFKGTDKVYVGQSVNMEKRWGDHYNFMKNGTHYNYKIQDTYNKFGSPSFEIWYVDKPSELNTLEISLISDLNTYNTGLNCTAGGQDGTSSGTQAPGSKYSKNDILYCIQDMAKNISMTILEASRKHGIAYDTLYRICSNKLHGEWLSVEYPEVHKTLVNNKSERRKSGNIAQSNTCNATGKGIMYPRVTSPNGVQYEVTNAAAFAILHKLNRGHLVQVLKGREASHKGWYVEVGQLGYKKHEKVYGSLVSPSGEAYNNITNISEFARLHSITRTGVGMVLSGKQKSHKGWTLAV